MKILRASAITLLLCALCANVRAEEPEMFAEQPGAHGFLYEVKPKQGGAHLYVFGTLHVGTSGTTPFTRAVRQALNSSKQLALEADPSNLGAMARVVGGAVMYPPDDSLDRHIPAATLAELRKVLPRVQLEEGKVMRMRLWLVPMAIGLAQGEKIGLSGSYGTEIYLAAWAGNHKMPILELEGAEAQLKLIASEPADLQLESLDDTLRDVQSGEAEKKLQKIVRAWNESDVPAAETIVRQAHTSKRRSEKDFARRLLDDRNVNMAARADELLRTGAPTTFLAVGTAHLFGDLGILALLRKRGYTTTQIR